MAFDLERLEKFVQSARKSDFIDRSISERIFEQIPHGYTGLEDVNFCLTRSQKAIDAANNIADGLSEDSINSDFYLTTTPSFFYTNLLNDVKIPTHGEFYEGEDLLHVCRLNLDTDHNDYKEGLYFLAYMNLSEEHSVLLCESVLCYIEEKIPSLTIIKLSSTSVRFKRAVLENSPSELDILSVSNQQKYKICVGSILSYKNANSKTSNDCSRMDNLQYFTVDQQLRAIVFSLLHPLLTHCYVRINRIKNIIEPNGNLSIKFLLVDSDGSSTSLTKQQCFDYLIDFGLMISPADLDGRIHFGDWLNENIKIEICIPGHLSCRNSCYPLMFRMFDSTLSKKLEPLEKKITSGDYDEAQNLIFTII